MLLDAAQLTQQEMYRILIASVIPRPIAWAGTRSRNGVNNLAPFSFYNCFSSNPPIVGFSVMPRADGRKKDTLQNIEDSGCFTLNCVSHRFMKEMSRSAALLEPGNDEFAYAGLEAAEATHVAAPYVKEALLAYECTLHDIVRLGSGPGSGNLILGQVRYVHVRDELYRDGRIDFETLDPVGRLAGDWYSTIRDRFEMERG